MFFFSLVLKKKTIKREISERKFVQTTTNARTLKCSSQNKSLMSWLICIEIKLSASFQVEQKSYSRKTSVFGCLLTYQYNAEL